MSILFELGSGQGACLCVEKKQVLSDRYIYYWYSRIFQVHNVNIGTIVISWRLRAYRREERK